jgi:hypothetical protein
MAAHQRTEAMPLVPIGVPLRKPRNVSMKGVKGWCSANHRSAVGIDSVGTNPLPKNGRRTRNIGRLLADSTLCAAMPMATDSQMRAYPAIATRPAAPSSPTTPPSGRYPMASAAAITTTVATRVWIRLPMTWPVSTAAREMAMVRNRATMPSVMSMAIEMAVPWAAPAAVIMRMAGTT